MSIRETLEVIENELSATENEAASGLIVSDMHSADEMSAGASESEAHLGDGEELWGNDDSSRYGDCPGW